MTSDLLNQTELQKKLGISHTTFYRHARRDPHFFTQFEVSRPIGWKKYSRQLVESYLAGESVVRFGKMRRAS